jgi:hypothetical protein
LAKTKRKGIIMKKETFIRGLQLINSILSEQHQIKGSTIDTYYLILNEYDDNLYINAIMNLLKKEDLRYGAPSPATIINYINIENKSSEKALEIFDYIKRDILLFGPRKPKYKKNIEKAIKEIGGWDKLRIANEYEIKKFEKSFVECYEDKNSQKVLESKTQEVLT